MLKTRDPAAPDANVCPLCGGDNSCVMARGEDSPCWCREKTFPAALLDAVPADAQGKACICRKCVDAYEKTLKGDSS